MPLTLTLSAGLLPEGSEHLAYKRLAEAMLKWHGLTGNETMTANVVGSVHVLPQHQTFVGMQETPAAFIEWKVPAFAFTDAKVREGYFQEASDIIHELSGAKHPKDKIFINVVHAVDGAWNFNGQPMTNAQISEAVSKG
jgi:hypothetical protein